MNILGIDTSTASLSVALTIDGVLKYELNQNHALTHSERLLPYIEQMMEKIGFDFTKIDRIACTVGPGSFTGIRIGVSVANAFSMAWGKPVVGISTLEAMAFAYRYTNYAILSTTDAQRENVYGCFFKAKGEGELECLSEEKVWSLEQLEKEVSCYEKIILVGDAVRLWKDIPKHVRLAPPDMNFPRASALCILAEEDIRLKETYIEPVYLRKSQAEIQFDERQAKGQ